MMLCEQNNSPTAPKECHPTLGFLPEGFDGRCREIVNSLVATELKKQIRSEAESSQEQSGSKRKFVEEETDAADEVDKNEGDLEEEEEDDGDTAEEIIDSDMEESLQIDIDDE